MNERDEAEEEECHLLKLNDDLLLELSLLLPISDRVRLSSLTTSCSCQEILALHSSLFIKINWIQITV